MTSKTGSRSTPHSNTARNAGAGIHLSGKQKGSTSRAWGGVQLSPNQIKMLSEGHTIPVEDMKRTDGALFSSFRHAGQGDRPAAIYTP